MPIINLVSTKILNNELLNKILDTQLALIESMFSLNLSNPTDMIKLKSIENKLKAYRALDKQVEDFVTQRLREIESLL